VRVDTHSARAQFEFEDWKDMSDKIDILFFIEKITAIRLHVYDDFRYSNKALRMYDEQKNDFINHNNRDVHYDFSYHEEIPGHIDNIGCYSDG
jgi:hypothetical protein